MADLTVSNSKNHPVPTEAEPPSDPAAGDHTDVPKDVAEQDTGDTDVATKDDSWLTRVTDATKDASKKAWELTAEAQRKANERSKKAGDEFFEEAGEKAGISRHKMKAQRDLHKATGWTGIGAPTNPGTMPIDEIPSGASTVIGLASDVDVVVATHKAVEEAGEGVRVTQEAIDAHRLAESATPGGRLFKKVGQAAGWVSLGYGAVEIYKDLTDGNGLSEDSIEPAADMAVTGLGMKYGSNPYVAAFSIGYTVGGWLDDKFGFSNVGYAAAEGEIAQRSNTGFLADRAMEMDVTTRHRIDSGTWTESDAYRARSIVREAREHGILDGDGRVDRDKLVDSLPDGTHPGKVDRIVGGIERAVSLERNW